MNRSSGPREFGDAEAEAGKYFTDAADRGRNNAGRRVLADATAMKNELQNLVLWGAEDVKLTLGAYIYSSALSTRQNATSEPRHTAAMPSVQPRRKALTCRRGVHPIGSGGSHSMHRGNRSQTLLAKRAPLSMSWQTSERYVRYSTTVIERQNWGADGCVCVCGWVGWHKKCVAVLDCIGPEPAAA